MNETGELIEDPIPESEVWKRKYTELKEAYDSIVSATGHKQFPDRTISKRKNPLHEESMQLLKTVTSEVEAVLFVLDKEGVFTFSDGRGLAKLGLRPGEVVGQSAIHIYKDYAPIVEAIERSLKGEQVRAETLSVASLEFDMTLKPIIDDASGVKGVVGLAIDISEAKKIERDLQQSRSQLSALMSNMPGMVYSCANDQNWTMKFVSEGAEELTGYPSEALIDNREIAFNEIIHPDDRMHVSSMVQASISQDKRYDIEYRIVTRSGEVKHVWERGRKLHRPDDPVEYLEGFITDITEKKRLEEELNSNYTILRMAGKTARFGGWSVDLKTNLVLWSDEVREIHEVPLGFVPYVSEGISFYAPEWHDKITALFSDCAERGIPYSEEMEIITAKGRRIWIRTTGEAVTDKEGKICRVEGSFQDIDEKKRAEEALRRSEVRLKELNATKDKFFSIIAHDLRSPFNSFLGLTQIMTSDLPSLSTSQLQEISVSMSKSATNLHRLLENLLQWSQIQSDTIPFRPESLRLSELVALSMELMAGPARKKEIEIDTEIPDDIQVYADSNMIQTVLRNLISNSVKFTPTGGHISVSARHIENGFVNISVRDTGIGMSSEIAGNLFRIDHKSNRPGTNGEPGTGLGLLLCKEFAEKHGGTIEVESREGIGSTFTISLPLKQLT
jgi:PAS domain S-box-containing protein